MSKPKGDAAKVDAVSGFSGWLQRTLAPLVKVAVDEAVTQLHDEINNDMKELENRVIGQITQLPGLVASQVENVALDAEQVAQKVAASLEGILPNLLNGVFDPGAIAREVIQGIGGGIHIPGFGVGRPEGKP